MFDGPFIESKELIGGYVVVSAESLRRRRSMGEVVHRCRRRRRGGRPGVGVTSRSQERQRYLAVLPAVEIHQKHPLPAAEVQPAVGDRHRLRRPQERRATVCMAVSPFARHDVDGTAGEVVVRVGSRFRREALEERFEVRKEQRLVLVDHQAGGGMPGLRDQQSFHQARLVDRT